VQGYLLSLSSLLAVMQGVSGTHRFHAELPARTIGKDIYVTEIMIHDGKLITCQIKKQAQQLLVLQQDRAVSMIEEMGELNWSLVSPPRPIQKHLSPTTERIPIRLIVGTLPTTLSHRQKQVLSLMDRPRTVEHIARLLHLSSQEVQSILHDLQQKQLISFEERMKDDADSQ
jgi:DNA-binding NarL/FixJ family response regulator